jgi:hypothetical protein
MSDYDPIIPQPRTASATLNKALATYEDILVDALLAQHGGRNRLRLLGDEDLHRARLAIWREQVTADEWFADIPDPVLAISRVMALGMARQAVEREEERRERARQFHNVPRMLRRARQRGRRRVARRKDPAAGSAPLCDAGAR